MINTSEQYRIQEYIQGTESSEIYKAIDSLTGEPVILKTINTETMSPKALAKLRNEYNILQKLKSGYVPRAIDFVKLDQTFFLVMEYCGGVSLSQYIKERRMSVKEFLHLAIEIVGGLSEIHKAGIIHKDLTPSNIIYNPRTRKITIVDFGISAEFSFEKPLMVDPSASEGTLFYISPEQTGRMNCPVDFRTDFYSLGITLFEMLCGRRPFDSASPAELIYDHVARVPLAARMVNSEVPEMLSRMIFKLMTKMPENRYLSTEGILFDLKKCLAYYDEIYEIPEFQMGLGDYYDRIEIPHKLYGREEETVVLEEAYHSILKGGRCAVFISGQSGVGKTSLVGEVYKHVLESNGIMISGKFDQYHRDIPYYALFQLVGNYCDAILSENENTIAIWRKCISEALGQDAVLLVDKVPRLALIIGQPQPLPELSPVEAGIRFKAAVQRMLAAVASPLQPVVIFIDDIHLANSESMDILGEIMSNEDISGLMLVACYRDNEVDSGHPVNLSLKRMKQREINVRHLSLSGLTLSAVTRMLSDTLNSSTDKVMELAGIVYSKTHGNPFYIKQFLMLCHRDGMIRLGGPGRDWSWDLDAIKVCPAKENVIDFLTRNTDQLSKETVSLLSIGACGGQSFSTGFLAGISGMEQEEISRLLKPAVTIEVIYPIQNDDGDSAWIRFQFAHDRFQQLFYTILPEDRRSDIHYALAKCYEEARDCTGGNEDIQFYMADNYAKAFERISPAKEKKRLAGILLKAARAATLLASYDMAARYLEQIIGFLEQAADNEDALQAEEEFIFSVYAAYHLVLCGLSRYEEADEIYRQLQRLTAAPVDLTESCCLQAVSLSNRGRYRDAFFLGIGLLETLGVHFPEEDLYPTTLAEIEEYYAEFRGRNYEGTLAEDKKEFAIARILNRIAAASFFCDPLYSSWTIITSARRSLVYGYTPDGLQLYASLMHVLVPFRNDYKRAYEAACAAKRVAEQGGYKNELYRVYHVFSLFTCHWFEDLKNSIPYARESFKGNVTTGDFEFACYSYFTTQQAVLETGQSIGELFSENEAALAFAKKTGNLHGLQSYLSYTQLYKALKGTTNSWGSFEDDGFREEEHLENIHTNLMARCYFYILRALSAAIYLDYDKVYELTEAAVPVLPAITGFYPLALHNFLHSLSICKRMEKEDCGSEERKRLHEVLDQNQKWLQERAADAPGNFMHLYSAVKAELAGFGGSAIESVMLYEKAIREAEMSNRPYHYAIICELAAQRFLKLNSPKTAANFLREAYATYLAWDADGKARQLKENNEGLFHVSAISKRNHGIMSLSGTSVTRSNIDFNALITASQTISEEINQEAILEKLIQILLEVSGAQVIYYITKNEEGRFIIRAEGHSEGGKKCSIEKRAVETDCISLRILNYADRTRETVVLDDASVSNMFKLNDYVLACGSKSILCMPVINKRDLKGLLYLENKLIEGAFDKKRLEALTTIASQLAISLENAYLYSNLKFLVDNKTKELREEIGIRKLAEKRLQHMANHDSLTNLPNRRMFQNFLEHSLEAASYDKSIIAVLFVDLDGFKSVNDYYGHEKGDLVLVTIAERLLDTIRGCDMVSRLGGDEFILVIENVKSKNAIEKLCQRIIDTIGEPIQIDEDGTKVVVTSSIGICLSKQNGSKVEELISNSDRAMYVAKERGKNQYSFYY